MSVQKSVLLVLILAVLSGLLFHYVARRGPVTAPSTDVGTVSQGMIAPGFTLKDLDGNSVSLAALKGKIVLLNFWATWCEPCLDEMSSLERLYRRFKDRKFVVLAINLNERAEDLQKYVEESGLTFPILLQGQKVASRYGTEKVPESYLIESRGIVRDKIIGAKQWDSPEILKLFDKEVIPRVGE